MKNIIIGMMTLTSLSAFADNSCLYDKAKSVCLDIIVKSKDVGGIMNLKATYLSVGSSTDASVIMCHYFTERTGSVFGNEKYKVIGSVKLSANTCAPLGQSEAVADKYSENHGRPQVSDINEKP